eukprot:6201580-Pleurochrysis_carterae.AAC.2
MPEASLFCLLHFQRRVLGGGDAVFEWILGGGPSSLSLFFLSPKPAAIGGASAEWERGGAVPPSRWEGPRSKAGPLAFSLFAASGTA